MPIEDLVTKGDLLRFIRQAFTTPAGNQPVKPRRFLTASIPVAAECEGEIIYVSDAAAGAHFQGSIGGSWVNLG